MKKQWNDIINPFETGFRYGAGGYGEMTAREIEEKFPYYDYVDVIAFNEGWKDGRNNDTFRLNMGRNPKYTEPVQSTPTETKRGKKK